MTSNWSVKSCARYSKRDRTPLFPDLNAEAVFGICRNDIPTLTATVEKMITDLNHAAV